MHPDPARDLLLQIASQGPLTLAGDLHSLESLLERGLLRRVEAPRSDALGAQYEALQERHQRFLEAKALVERLQAPRKGLTRWLAGSPASKEDLEALHALLSGLDIKVRDCSGAEELASRLDWIRERLQVDDRDCMDRMAWLDREINLLEKQGSEIFWVESLGHVVLSDEGKRLLPETQALDDLESVFNLVSGPRQQKISDYEHFRKDPGTILAFVLGNPARMDRASDVVGAIESPAQILDRSRDLQQMKHRNALLIRLLRCFRNQPKRAHYWVARERLQELGSRAGGLVPPSMEQSETRFLYAADLLLAGPGSDEPAQRFDERLRLMEAVRSGMDQGLEALRPGEIAAARLALALMHEVLFRNVTGPVLAGRMAQRMAGAALDAMAHAPVDLGDPSARLLFGYHLVHWADFQAPELPSVLATYRGIEAAFSPEGRGRRVPTQVLLHALAVLQRLKSLDRIIAPGEYAGTFQRILRWVQSHRDLSRTFQVERLGGEEEFHLAANLTARAYFSGVQADWRCVPDAGAAGAYEDPNRPAAPLLGQAFGTLFVDCATL